MKQLWVEKYRPTSIDGYVFRDSAQRKTVERWLSEGIVPHLLLSGTAGIGKTTLAKVLFNELDINPLDIMEINGSRENSVDDMRHRVTTFISMIPFGNFKIVRILSVQTGHKNRIVRNRERLHLLCYLGGEICRPDEC